MGRGSVLAHVWVTDCAGKGARLAMTNGHTSPVQKNGYSCITSTPGAWEYPHKCGAGP